jgi:hypothetical protein
VTRISRRTPAQQAQPSPVAQIGQPESQLRDRGVACEATSLYLAARWHEFSLTILPVHYYPQRRLARSRHSLFVGEDARDLYC